MQAIVVDAYGGPDVLRLAHVPSPEPGPREARVRVMAAGINFSDVLRRRNAYLDPETLPFRPGSEIAGVVEAVGAEVAHLKPGSRVFSMIGSGGYAQEAIVPASRLIPMPSALSFEQAAALPVQGLTAALILREVARLQRGETVLVQAAAGGVGLIAVQLATEWGARVIALASTEEKRRLTRARGAEHAVDYTHAGWADEVRALAPGGIDVVLEATGGATMIESLRLLAPFGRSVVYGAASGEALAIDVRHLMKPNQTISGFHLVGWLAKADVIGRYLVELIGLVASDRLHLQIGGRYALASAAEAHRAMESRTTTGKLILEPNA